MKKLVATISSTLLGSLFFVILVSGAPGNLDGTFGSGGMLTLQDSAASAVGVQSSGRVVVVQGTVVTGYLSDGSIDRTFGFNGSNGPSLQYGHFFAIAIQSDNKIVTAGFGSDGPPHLNDFAIARFNADGTLDTTFGTGGKVLTRIVEGNDYAYSVSIQPDGKILAAGRSGRDFAIVRYNSDGSLDGSFGSGGKVVTDLTGGYDQANSVAIQPDGKFVIVGSTYHPAETYLLRYTSAGSLDPTFGTEGIVVGAGGNSVAIQSGGKIVVGGSRVSNGNADFSISRYLGDGSPDLAFGEGGSVTTDFNGGNDQVVGIILQPDDIIIASGIGGPSLNPSFALAKYSANGEPDTTFGAAGKVLTDISPEFDVVKGAAVQPDGRILLAGFTDWDGTYNDDYMNLAVLRYQNNAPVPTVTISGRAVSPSGMALRNITVSLIDSNGHRRTTLTSSFGLFTFTGVPSNTEYSLTANSKRYRFAPRTIAASTTSLSGLDLIASE